MKAQDLQFTHLIQGAKQFIIPIFQRTYSWEKSHCEQLWNDIIRVGSHPELDSHFIGSAVYIPEQETSAAITRWQVIDGQQRITTITLLLLALMRRLEKENIELPVSSAEVEDYYLRNKHGKSEQSFKLLLTKTDKDTLIALLDEKKPPEYPSIRIMENYEFFTDKIANIDLNILFTGIKKLMIVDVRLQQGIDNPQMIFESMNSTGKALTQTDLIRNYMLMGLPIDQQTTFYQNYWRPMEELFGVAGYNDRFDDFIRFFLIIFTHKDSILKDEVYVEFKTYSQKSEKEQLLKKLLVFAEYYCNIALGKEKDYDLSSVFKDIHELRADVCYPFLMKAYHDFKHNKLNKTDFIEIVLIVESFVFRRAVCDIPTNSLRQIFANVIRAINEDKYLESIQAYFMLLPSYRRFPRDEEFILKLQKRNLYEFNRRNYWLRRFENYGRKEYVIVQDYTIEHIMPQKPNSAWRRELGNNWQIIHETYLHTLGNLTLTRYNAEYSNHLFSNKRDMEGGFKQSPLKLNEMLGNCETWNETAIQERATRLAKKAVEIWKCPSLDEQILELYRKEKGRKTTKYTLASHPIIDTGPMRELFQAFRKEVLALDECVREEYLKRYVAYKAESNFVAVIPHTKRLRLRINLNINDIDDPRNMCRDLSKTKRENLVEVMFETKDDIHYVIGLVRQALERQLGEGDSEL